MTEELTSQKTAGTKPKPIPETKVGDEITTVIGIGFVALFISSK